mmetsp:Transcript_47935/g.74864  ORF Transcript_47935/g.74864 Transcript_47935/m.74864 type:complete len:705 (+) Transcript_47935:203-2317(+)
MLPGGQGSQGADGARPPGGRGHGARDPGSVVSKGPENQNPNPPHGQQQGSGPNLSPGGAWTQGAARPPVWSNPQLLSPEIQAPHNTPQERRISDLQASVMDESFQSLNLSSSDEAAPAHHSHGAGGPMPGLGGAASSSAQQSQEESDLDRKIVNALVDYLRGRDWVEITTPRQINEACKAIVRSAGVSMQKLNKKLKKGSWREKLTSFISRYPLIFVLDMFENNFCVKLRDDATSESLGEEGAPAHQRPSTQVQASAQSTAAAGHEAGAAAAGAEEVLVAKGGVPLSGSSAEEQVIELVRALLLHLRGSEGKEWVDITNMPKAAHMMQRKRPVVGVSLRWGSRDVGPEEWQRLMAEIRTRHGKLANFLSKHPLIFELRNRPGGKEIRLVPEGRRPEGLPPEEPGGRLSGEYSRGVEGTAGLRGYAEAGAAAPSASRTEGWGVGAAWGPAGAPGPARGVEGLGSGGIGSAGLGSASLTSGAAFHPRAPESASATIIGPSGLMTPQLQPGTAPVYLPSAIPAGGSGGQALAGSGSQTLGSSGSQSLGASGSQGTITPQTGTYRITPSPVAGMPDDGGQGHSTCWVLLENEFTVSDGKGLEGPSTSTVSSRVAGVYASREVGVQEGRRKYMNYLYSGWQGSQSRVPGRVGDQGLALPEVTGVGSRVQPQEHLWTVYQVPAARGSTNTRFVELTIQQSVLESSERIFT